MAVAYQIGIFILFALAVFAVFNVLKIFVLDKVAVNKWFVLAAAVIVFIVQIVLSIEGNLIVTFAFSAVFVILLLWFFDLMQYGTKRKEKKLKIKPKAKPNRVKHLNNDKK